MYLHYLSKHRRSRSDEGVSSTCLCRWLQARFEKAMGGNTKTVVERYQCGVICYCPPFYIPALLSQTTVLPCQACICQSIPQKYYEYTKTCTTCLTNIQARE